jgi:lysophospholipase L1-like esterase
MQRRLLLAVLCALVCAGVASVSAQIAPPPEPEFIPPGYSPRGLGTTYLALGDSLATGYEEPGDPSQNVPGNTDNLPGYPQVLYNYLLPLSPSLAYKNLGRDGETSTSMITATGTVTISQLAQAVDFIRTERAAGRRVGLVTLDIGGNDMIQQLQSPAPNVEAALQLYRTNLTRIVDELLAALTTPQGGRDGDLILMDYYNPYPGLKAQFPTLPFPDPDAYAPQFNAVIKEIAAPRALPVAEVFAAFAGRQVQLVYVQRDPKTGGYYTPNPFDPAFRVRFDYHPRPLGHQQIAAAFLNVSGYKVSGFLPLVVKLPEETPPITTTAQLAN